MSYDVLHSAVEPRWPLIGTLTEYSIQNYNIRYQNNRDYEHSFGQSYQNSQLELLEEIEELDELEKIEESVNSAKPYIFMASAIVLILVSVALILKTIFCKSNGLHEDIKHFT